MSWFLFYQHSRRMEKWTSLKPLLKSFLEDFKLQRNPGEVNAQIGRGFSVQIFPAGQVHSSFFMIAGSDDGEAGSLLIPMMSENLVRCIREKEIKTAPKRTKYPVWWLALSDHIGFGLDTQDRANLRAACLIDHKFDRVIIIDPNDPSRAFDF